MYKLDSFIKLAARQFALKLDKLEVRLNRIVVHFRRIVFRSEGIFRKYIFVSFRQRIIVLLWHFIYFLSTFHPARVVLWLLVSGV